jgi:ribosome-associated protein
LTPLTLLSSRKKTTGNKLNRSSRLFKTIIQAIQDKKGEKIISLDLRKIDEAVADFFVICEASNPQQVRAIGENIQEKVKNDIGETAYKHEGYQALQWVLIDYVNIVVHIMLPETRKFYALDEMWSDAQTMEHLDR